MSDNMNSDEQIQQLYNKTKELKSPSDLDNMILGKIRATEEEEPTTTSSEKSWFYLPIAASILLVVLLQFKDADETKNQLTKPIEIVQLPIEKESKSEKDKTLKKQLPGIFLLPNEDINSKIVPACTGNLVVPEGILDKLDTDKSKNKEKSSDLPIQLIYPNDASKKNPECDRVSNQIFKK